ncbi:MAG: PKD domain-containing protein [Bacteroidia bacterium]
MKRFAIYMILMTVLGLSCQKKKYPDSSTQDSPVFYFRGTVNGVPVELNAGLNNYYMYSAYEQDMNNVYSFNGDLRPENCSNCPNSIKISINDYKSSAAGGNVNIDSSLVAAYYPLSLGSSSTTAPAPVNFISQFYPISNHSIASCYWEFGDGSTSTSASLTSHTYKKPGNYLVSLTITDSASNSSKISNIQKIGLGGVRASMSATATTLNASISGISALNSYSCTLNYGDNTYTTGIISASSPSFSVPAHTYTPGSYIASLRVANMTDASDTANAICNLQSQGNSCIANYQASSNSLPNPKAYCNITISWTDASGNLYSSSNVAQPESSYFRIVSVEDYSNNANGKKTKKLHVKFKCNVYQLTTPSNSLTIDNGDAVILVAYQ